MSLLQLLITSVICLFLCLAISECIYRLKKFNHSKTFGFDRYLYTRRQKSYVYNYDRLFFRSPIFRSVSYLYRPVARVKVYPKCQIILWLHWKSNFWLFKGYVRKLDRSI